MENYFFLFIPLLSPQLSNLNRFLNQVFLDDSGRSNKIL